MNVASVCLAVFLILYAIVTFGWLVISATVLGIFALIAGIAILLAEFQVYPTRRV